MRNVNWGQRLMDETCLYYFIRNGQQDSFRPPAWKVFYLRPVLGRPLLLLLEVLGLSSFSRDCRMLSSVYARYTWDRSTSNGYRQQGRYKSISHCQGRMRKWSRMSTFEQKTIFYNSRLFLFYLEQGSVFSYCCQCKPHISESITDSSQTQICNLFQWIQTTLSTSPCGSKGPDQCHKK